MKAILAYGPQLRVQIHKTIKKEKAKASTPSSWRNDFLGRLQPYAVGGKMIRGNLVCFSYEAFAGRQPTASVIETAAALELIHSALLIHDDVMDNDDFRRGHPSMHRQYKETGRHKRLIEPERFGANMALCGGDMCLFMAFGLLGGMKPAMNKLFNDVLVDVCDGQMQDIYSQALSEAPSKRAIYSLMRSKTASYTLSLPLAVGAALAAQPPSALNKLRRVGDTAGIIFQIRDDELGALGDTAETGKPVGADIREGKKTLIYYYLMKTCDSRERRIINDIFGNPDITHAEVKTVQRLVRRHRIPQLLNNEVKVLEKKAYDILLSLDLPNRHSAELRSLISFCSKRRA